AGRYMPRCCESTKMVKANHIHMGEQSTHAIDAPAIASLPQRLPVVDRVAPELSLRAKVIGRYACHALWPVLFVQQKYLRVSPDRARMRRHEKGQITNQAHALGTGISSEPFALAEQQELSKATLIDIVRQIAPRSSQSRRRTVHQLYRPLEVVGAVVTGFQRPEQ